MHGDSDPCDPSALSDIANKLPNLKEECARTFTETYNAWYNQVDKDRTLTNEDLEVCLRILNAIDFAGTSRATQISGALFLCDLLNSDMISTRQLSEPQGPLNTTLGTSQSYQRFLNSYPDIVARERVFEPS